MAAAAATACRFNLPRTVLLETMMISLVSFSRSQWAAATRQPPHAGIVQRAAMLLDGGMILAMFRPEVTNRSGTHLRELAGRQNCRSPAASARGVAQHEAQMPGIHGKCSLSGGAQAPPRTSTCRGWQAGRPAEVQQPLDPGVAQHATRERGLHVGGDASSPETQLQQPASCNGCMSVVDGSSKIAESTCCIALLHQKAFRSAYTQHGGQEVQRCSYIAKYEQI